MNHQFIVKKFGSQANTLVHMRAHTQEKSYRCKYCEQSFCDSSTLKKHLRTHTGNIIDYQIINNVK